MKGIQSIKKGLLMLPVPEMKVRFKDLTRSSSGSKLLAEVKAREDETWFGRFVVLAICGEADINRRIS